ATEGSSDVSSRYPDRSSANRVVADEDLHDRFRGALGSRDHRCGGGFAGCSGIRLLLPKFQRRAWRAMHLRPERFRFPQATHTLAKLGFVIDQSAIMPSKDDTACATDLAVARIRMASDFLDKRPGRADVVQASQVFLH